MRRAPRRSALPMAVLLVLGGVPLLENVGAIVSGPDPVIPSLVGVPLRTGYRFAASWTTPDATVGTLHYRVNGGAWNDLDESSGGNAHLLVVDGLPAGGDLEFYVTYDDGGSPVTSANHVVKLSNAHRAKDPAGKYTLNLLVIANERLLERQTLIDAMDHAAPRFYDATDGNIRFGTVLLVFGDWLDNPDLGFACHVLFLVPPVAPCTRRADAVFTMDLCPGAAACVVGGTLDNPDAAIIMNDLPFGNTYDIIGETFVHELGHYAFNMVDLYGWGEGCVVPAYDISIMDDSGRTEFDDSFTSCPNAADVPDYQPSWDYLRSLYTLVPNRPGGPNPGPVGQTGGAYDLRVLTFL